jgi:hypothetical protein
MATPETINITITAVHPTVTVVTTPDGQTELPTAWFIPPPQPGQVWQIYLEHQPTEVEKITQLNDYLKRD